MLVKMRLQLLLWEDGTDREDVLLHLTGGISDIVYTTTYRETELQRLTTRDFGAKSMKQASYMDFHLPHIVQTCS